MKKLTAVLLVSLSLIMTGCESEKQNVYSPAVSEFSSYSSLESSSLESSSTVSSSAKSSSVESSSTRSSSIASSSTKSSSVESSSTVSSSVKNSSTVSSSVASSSTKSSNVASSNTVSSTEPEPQNPETNEEIAKRMLSEMTVREKVGQLFIVRPEALSTPDKNLSANYKSVSAMSQTMKNNFKKYPVGGVALFSANIVSPSQTLAFNKELLNACEIPLFIAVDEEGGRVARLANNKSFGLKKYESAQAVGESGNSADALEMGNTIGGYLKKYGFNMDFAPDADVFTNPKNTVIGDRAFSTDAEIAAKMAKAMAQGLRNNGIIPVYKHFPGHGDTSEDSHTGNAYANKTQEEMENCEWLPFMGAGNLDGVMVGHISAPKITGDNTPATLSEKMVTEILRGKLGFDGLVITDALAMGAVNGEEDYAVRAILAGCDILLMPDNLAEAFESVVNAVNNGVISEDRLDESVLRILRYKLEYGII